MCNSKPVSFLLSSMQLTLTCWVSLLLLLNSVWIAITSAQFCFWEYCLSFRVDAEVCTGRLTHLVCWTSFVHINSYLKGFFQINEQICSDAKKKDVPNWISPSHPQDIETPCWINGQLLQGFSLFPLNERTSNFSISRNIGKIEQKEELVNCYTTTLHFALRTCIVFLKKCKIENT